MIVTNGYVEVGWYREEELQTLVRIHAICLPQERWQEEDFPRFVMKREGQVCKVIRRNGKGVGSLLYRITPEAVRIARVTVLPNYRRQGLGQFAINELIGPRSIFKAKRRFLAHVHEDNREGRELLLSLDFRPARDGVVLIDHYPADEEGLRRDGYVFEFIKKERARRLVRHRHTC